jgi:hypothetical protein
MVMADKRPRNTRPRTYRPRTEAQKQRRQQLETARAHDRERRQHLSEEGALRARLDELESALRDEGREGVHRRRHATPLDDIADDETRFEVLKARVERLEALWSINRRRREARGKIIIGGALLAEAVDEMVEDGSALLDRLVDIIDRRVKLVRDRLTVRELLGNVPLPLRPGGHANEGVQEALTIADEELQHFDELAESAMADDREADPLPSEVDPDYADLDPLLSATG